MDKQPKSIGMLLLAIWLFTWSLITLIPELSSLNLLLVVIAITAGIFIFLDR